MWVVWRLWGGEERRGRSQLHRPDQREERGGWRGPELAVRALECQAKDFSLDVVVSSRELLKVLEQEHSIRRMRFEEEESGGGDPLEGFEGGELTGKLSAEQARND